MAIRNFAPASVTEEQTKRFENQQFANMFEQPNYQLPSLLRNFAFGKYRSTDKSQGW